MASEDIIELYKALDGWVKETLKVAPNDFIELQSMNSIRWSSMRTHLSVKLLQVVSLSFDHDIMASFYAKFGKDSRIHCDGGVWFIEVPLSKEHVANAFQSSAISSQKRACSLDLLLGSLVLVFGAAFGLYLKFIKLA